MFDSLMGPPNLPPWWGLMCTCTLCTVGRPNLAVPRVTHCKLEGQTDV